mmetsp:Transcript_97684/g.281879  ORF Transcript_97684/g.281879 Transcript_97684/m.281879 type:complete len:205 (+) Transcript_97684:81-695(+)
MIQASSGMATVTTLMPTLKSAGGTAGIALHPASPVLKIPSAFTTRSATWRPELVKHLCLTTIRTVLLRILIGSAMVLAMVFPMQLRPVVEMVVTVLHQGNHVQRTFCVLLVFATRRRVYVVVLTWMIIQTVLLKILNGSVMGSAIKMERILRRNVGLMAEIASCWRNLVISMVTAFRYSAVQRISPVLSSARCILIAAWKLPNG